MTDAHRRLERRLGLVDVFAISTGAMFSSGFFLLPGIAFSQAGAYLPLAYALSALLIIPAMLSKAELASAMPRAGGTYYYLDRSMGPLVGTVGGLGTWIAMGLKNTFALIGIGAYLTLFLEMDVLPVALGLALAFTAINVLGAKETARLQRWLVYALLAILSLFLIAGLAKVVPAGLVETARARFGSAPQADIDGVLATVGLVFVSYAGLTKVSGIAEEVKNPNRNILLGMVLSLLAAGVTYVVGTFVLVLVVPPETLAGDLAPVATGAEIVFDWLPARTGVALIVIAAVAAFASTANAGIMSASRYLLAMGRDRLIGTAFQKVGRFGTPTLAVLVTGGFVVVALLTLDVVTVAKLASAFQLLMFAFVNLAVIVMRESRIEAYAPAVRSPLYPWLQLLGIFLSLALIIELGRSPPLFTLALVALGVGWFFLYAKQRVVRQGAILHWFERLGRHRFDPLEAEMWTLLKETGLPKDDQYDALIARASFVDVDDASTLADAVEVAARRFADQVAVDAPTLAACFAQRVTTGLVPISDGLAVAHMRLDDQEEHELLALRVPHAFTVDVRMVEQIDADEVEVGTIFFLVSPDEDPGEHLRLLAKLATHVEHPEFAARWRAARTEGEQRRLLVEDRLNRLAARLTRRLQAGPRGWYPKTEPSRFESVLVVDTARTPTPVVLDAAEELAAASHARLTLAQPMEQLPDHALSRADVEEVGRSEQAERLARRAEGMRARGIEARSLILPGKPWLEVIREVIREGHDLVVAEAADADRGFDTATQNLLRKCPCPLWVVRPNDGLRSGRVLAAVDATATDEQHRALNKEILAFAAMVAAQRDADVHIVHAWREVGEQLLRKLRIERTGDWRRDYATLLDELLQGHRLDRSRTTIHLVEGEPAGVITDVAQQENIDLIILGTVCRTGVAGYLIGNTAETVLRQVSCAVLAVKPPGFETPVDLDVVVED
jgi:APA family basic amino acid/polyamine antiporter